MPFLQLMNGRTGYPGPMKRAAVVTGAVVVVAIVGLGGYAVGHQSETHGPKSAVLRSAAPPVIPEGGESLPPTTTTTVPPTTTTVAAAVVPNIVAVSTQCGCSAVNSEVTQAGFQDRFVPTSSGACYFNDPLNGQQEWNRGMIVDQLPSAGDLAPVGSIITLYQC
jgi:hypothetical protein